MSSSVEFEFNIDQPVTNQDTKESGIVTMLRVNDEGSQYLVKTQTGESWLKADALLAENNISVFFYHNIGMQATVVNREDGTVKHGIIKMLGYNKKYDAQCLVAFPEGEQWIQQDDIAH
jgi:hypothetical protein